MNKQDEYQALREEIMHSQQEIKNYRNLLYTIVAAILVFAVESGSAILFLVPFIAIIPIFLAEMHQTDSMLRIGAYIYVFIEPNTECQWETRLHKYDNIHRNEYSTKKSSIDSYLTISICCIILSILNLDLGNHNFNFYLAIFLQIIISVLCIYFFKTKRFDYLERKTKYISDWQNVKNLETN